MTSFRFDTRKSESNKRKHGISFPEALAIWKGPVFEFPVTKSLGEYGEMRYLVLGTIDGRHYTAVISYRGGAIRVISVRQSNEKEIALYASSVKKAKG